MRRVEKPRLSPEAQKRQDEVDALILSRYKDYRILATTQTYGGDIYDWLDPATVPGSEEPPPPNDNELPEGGDASKSKERLPLTEFDVYPEVRGPKGSVPSMRPAFEAYVDGSTEERSLAEFLAHTAPGQPSGQNRLYGGYKFDDEHLNRAVTQTQQFPGDVSRGVFNILEMQLNCGSGGSLEGVGVVVGRGMGPDQGTQGLTLRMNAEFYTAGYGSIGNNIGGWGGSVTGFVGAAGAPYGLGVALTFISDVGGPADAWSPLEFRYDGGNWWLSHNGSWLGYYPGSSFDLIDGDACEVSWYGEVSDPTPTSWTATNMGSGQFASTGHFFASYQWQTFYRDLAGHNEWPDASGVPFGAGNPTPGFNGVGPSDANCYTTSAPVLSGDRHFFLGGPGGDNTGCN